MVIGCTVEYKAQTEQQRADSLLWSLAGGDDADSAAATLHLAWLLLWLLALLLGVNSLLVWSGNAGSYLSPR